MQPLKKILAGFIFVLWAVGISAMPEITSLRLEVLLTGKMLDSLHTQSPFINSIVVSSHRHIMISTSHQFYLLGWGGMSTLGKETAGEIGAFAFTPDSLLMVIRDKDVCCFDSRGRLSRLYTLPCNGMGISAGKKVMYVYDRNHDKATKALYVIAQGGNYAKILEVTSPIESVIELDNRLVFASGNTLFQYNLKDKELKALASLPGNKIIQSVTADRSTNRIYFSTDNMVCAIKDTSRVLVTDKAGGTLEFFNGGLIVLNPEKKFLVRIVNMEHQLTEQFRFRDIISAIRQTKEPLTNTVVIDLASKKVPDEFIINLINTSKVNFNLSVDSLIALAGQHVSSPVIKAMKQVSKKQGTNSQNVSL